MDSRVATPPTWASRCVTVAYRLLFTRDDDLDLLQLLFVAYVAFFGFVFAQAARGAWQVTGAMWAALASVFATLALAGTPRWVAELLARGRAAAAAGAGVALPLLPSAGAAPPAALDPGEPNPWLDDERGEHTDREAVEGAQGDVWLARGIAGGAAASVLGNWNALREPRQGVALHYDDSTSDVGGVHWLTRDPACKVSYNEVVLDSGERVQIAPRGARAWGMGVCRPSNPAVLTYRDANSAFYNLALTAKAGDAVSPAQFAGVVDACCDVFREEGWPGGETWRITSHHLEAWPRGRKADVGARLRGLTLDGVRAAVAARML